MAKISLMVLLLILLCSFQGSSDKQLAISLNVRNGTGDDPMIVLWLEKEDDEGHRTFIKTLGLFSKDYKYYKELKLWNLKSRKGESRKHVDSVTGATIKMNRRKTIHIPQNIDGHNLLDGTYLLRLSSGKDKGKVFQTFKIFIPENLSAETFNGPGYVKSVDLKVINKPK